MTSEHSFSSGALQARPFDDISRPGSPGAVTGLELVLRRPRLNNDDPFMSPSKRYAVAGPGRSMLDDLREKEKHLRDRAMNISIEKKKERSRMEKELASLRVQLNHMREENETSHVEVNRLREERRTESESLMARYMKEVGEIRNRFEAVSADNEASERQMVEQILQYEREVEQLRADKYALEDDRTNQEEARASYEKQIAELRTRYEHELSEHETEVLAMRQRLHSLSTSASPGTSSASATMSDSTSVPMSRRARGTSMQPMRFRIPGSRTRHVSVLQNPGVTIGVVPLEPSPLFHRPSVPEGSEPLNVTSWSQASPAPTLPSDASPQFQESVRLAVKETLRQIGIENTDVSRTRSPRAKTGRLTSVSRRNAVKEQQGRISSDTDKMWKATVRNFWRNIHNKATAEDFLDYTPVTEDVVMACNEGAQVPEGNLELDFGSGWERSRWNAIVLRRIYDNILETRLDEGGWGLPDISEGYLMGLLQGQLKRSREAWARALPRFLPSAERRETNEEVAERIVQHNTSRSKAIGSRSRRQRKYDRRASIVEQVISIKASQNAVDLSAWQYFRKMLQLLSVDGMSSEEEETRKISSQTINVFLVKLCVWRADEITQYLRLVDKEGENPAICDPRGSRLCPRIPVQDPGSTVPCGLPRKMYDSQWLSGLEASRPEFVLDVLRVSQEVFELMTLVTRT